MKYKIKITGNVKNIVNRMDIDTLIKQLICPSIRNLKEAKTVKNLGSVFILHNKIDNIKKIIDVIKSQCEIPPLITSDMENGPGDMIIGATKFPPFMSISQSNSMEYAYIAGESAALEGKSLGFNWTLSPVADLSIEKDNPIVGLRSAGNNPEHVIKIIKSYMNGIQQNGMIATIKHFPGDGYGTYDQHLTVTENPLSIKDWNKLSGKIFKEIINSGIMAVMPGHISFPAYDTKDKVSGFYPPATCSKILITKLLKEELGFEGLIVSDAIDMGGFAGYKNIYEACVDFIMAGGDIILFAPNNEHFYYRMKEFIKQGILNKNFIIDRVCRIIAIKEQIGLFDSNRQEITLNKLKYQNTSSNIQKKSITLIRDRSNILPFKIDKKTKILHLIIMNNYLSKKKLLNLFTKEIKKYSNHVIEMFDPGPSYIFEEINNNKYDLVICSIGNKLDWGLNVIKLHGPVARNMMKGWMKLDTPVIFVSHFHPYIHKEYETSINTIINTYGSMDDTFPSLMRQITGIEPINKKCYVHD